MSSCNIKVLYSNRNKIIYTPNKIGIKLKTRWIHNKTNSDHWMEIIVKMKTASVRIFERFKSALTTIFEVAIFSNS